MPLNQKILLARLVWFLGKPIKDVTLTGAPDAIASSTTPGTPSSTLGHPGGTTISTISLQRLVLNAG
jgi:hypothetical protein